MKSITEIKEKIKKLSTLDKNFEIFGASSHQYKFKQAIPIDELEKFEDKYKVKLPEDYKAFMNAIGNGGAGPFFGIHPLQRDLGECNPENKFECLKIDFPHKEAWNWTDKIFSKFYELQGDEDEEIEDFFNNMYWEQYCKDDLTYGSICIAEYGCGLRFLLVITGNEKGKIWFDQRADRNGINPVKDKQGNTLSFSDWYVEWLDESIEKVKELEQ